LCSISKTYLGCPGKKSPFIDCWVFIKKIYYAEQDDTKKKHFYRQFLEDIKGSSGVYLCLSVLYAEGKRLILGDHLVQYRVIKEVEKQEVAPSI